MKNVKEVLSPIRYIKDKFNADIAERVEDLAIALAEGKTPASSEFNKLRYACANRTVSDAADLERFAADLADMWLANYNN